MGDSAIGQTVTFQGEDQQRVTLKVIAVGQPSALNRITGAQSDVGTATTADTTAYLLEVRYSAHSEFTAGETLVISSSDTLFSGSSLGVQRGASLETDVTAPNRHAGTKTIDSMPFLADWLHQTDIGWYSSLTVLWLALIYALINAIWSGFGGEFGLATVFGLAAAGAASSIYYQIMAGFPPSSPPAHSYVSRFS